MQISTLLVLLVLQISRICLMRSSCENPLMPQVVKKQSMIGWIHCLSGKKSSLYRFLKKFMKLTMNCPVSRMINFQNKRPKNSEWRIVWKTYWLCLASGIIAVCNISYAKIDIFSRQIRFKSTGTVNLQFRQCQWCDCLVCQKEHKLSQYDTG